MTTKTHIVSPLFIATALVLALPTVSACATTQTHGEQLDDSNLRNRVGLALTKDDVVKRTQIDVDVVDSVVYLRGETSNAAIKSRAEEVAMGVQGVRQVQNELVVGRDNDMNDGHPDAILTAKVSSKLATDPETKSRNIDVDTEDGVVTLSGIVENSDSSNRAEYLARTTDGVIRVVNELQVRTTAQYSG